MTPAPNLYLGMLSGTSRDGADTVLVRFPAGLPEVVAAQCVAYPAELAGRLQRLIDRRQRPGDAELEVADRELAEFFALCAWGLLDRAGLAPQDLSAVGSHGQTVWHNPAGPEPETIQLGDPQLLANLLGVATVGRFRQADLVAGGQGAPLAPLLHRSFLQPERGIRIVLNLGGIANVSVLHASGRVSGFDTGPGNCLLDAWNRKHRDCAFDDRGQWAAGGAVDAGLLQAMLTDRYFSAPPPKSTGVEHFNIHWLQQHLAAPGGISATDARGVQATLSELTARTVADAVRSHDAAEVLVCGGGVHNDDLLQRLRRALPGVPVESSASRGMDPDWMEGILFAWLARERLAGRPQDTRGITGAREPVLLGEVFEPA